VKDEMLEVTQDLEMVCLQKVTRLDRKRSIRRSLLLKEEKNRI